MGCPFKPDLEGGKDVCTLNTNCWLKSQERSLKAKGSAPHSQFFRASRTNYKRLTLEKYDLSFKFP